VYRGDAEDLGGRGLRGGDHGGQSLLGVTELGIDATQVVQEVAGELVSSGSHRAIGLDPLEQFGSLSCVNLASDTARDELTQHCVETASHLVAGPAEIPLALGPQLHHRGVILGANLLRGR
jgi:hypothetical protein